MTLRKLISIRLVLSLIGITVPLAALSSACQRAQGSNAGALEPKVALQQKAPSTPPELPSPTNLVRNGSFEGSTRYWNGVTEAMLDPEKPAYGQYSVHLKKDDTPDDQKKKGQRPKTTDYIRAGSFYLERGREVTVSLSIRANTPREVLVWLFPANRQVAQNMKILWEHKAAQRFQAGPEWSRVSFKATHDVPPEKWFQEQIFMLSINANDAWVDGVSVSYTDGESTYEPRARVEVAADALNLPGYVSETANLFAPGAGVDIRGAVSNATKQPQKLSIEWQLYDYAGERKVGGAWHKELTLAPGQTAREVQRMPLVGKGLMLARVSAFDTAGRLLDKSDFPLTVLPYPQAHTELDPSERIGIGVRGPHTLRLAQKLGFRWTRWYNETEWNLVQPKGPNDWKFPDETLAEVEAHGILPILLLYRLPDWAKAKPGDELPKDMNWSFNDPRWDDLTIKTAFDRHVEKIVERYKDKPYAWEFSNEPDLHTKFPPDLHFRMAVRAGRILKRIKPDAVYMVNSTLGRQTDYFQRFFELGGAKFIDAFSWHDYHPTKIGDAGKMRRLRQMFDAYGANDVQIWFNEGFTFISSSTDYAAPEVTPSGAVDVADWMTTNWVDMFAGGLEKCVVFYIGYEHQPKSLWDYYGAGTELWDGEGLPTVGVPMWNTMIQHIGKSQVKATYRPGPVTVHLFDDLRNERGVMVAWADEPTSFDLPVTGLVLEDATGGSFTAEEKNGRTEVQFTRKGQPLYLYTKDGQSADALALKLRSLSR